MTESEALKLMESLQISHDCEMVKTLDFKATVIKALEDLRQYRAIGTVEECRTAVERMKPKKAKGLRRCNQACCPNCNTVVLDEEFWMLDEYTYYCDSCGQAVKGIDWSK